MPVPSSGAISLNQFHVTAGGTSGTQCSINDADIRGLISKGSGVTMSFSEWYGASAGNPYEITANFIYNNIGGKYAQWTHEVLAGSIGSFSDNTLNGNTVIRIWLSHSTIGNYAQVDIAGNTSATNLDVLAGNRRYMRYGSNIMTDWASVAGTYQSSGNFTRYQGSYNSGYLPQSNQNNITLTWGT